MCMSGAMQTLGMAYFRPRNTKYACLLHRVMHGQDTDIFSIEPRNIKYASLLYKLNVRLRVKPFSPKRKCPKDEMKS